MARRILITGGAGFIGSHLADELLEHGFRVRALDSLWEQVHGPCAGPPEYLNPDVELLRGDIRDAAAVRQALEGVDAVYHFAAAVGVGQSMYDIETYVDVNVRGTAVLLEALTKKPVGRLIVASSMSIYGEGLYQGPGGAVHHNCCRSLEQLKAGQWEMTDGGGAELAPVPTPENKLPSLQSVYALSKFDQERMSLMIGAAYHIPTVALRFFNTYGTRQALSNPYTGVLAIFASRLLNNQPPLIFEDGRQLRDFVSVRDVAAACRAALDAPGAPGLAFNIASGVQYPVAEVAQRVAAATGKGRIEPQATRQYRAGDVRHCFADIGLARRVLGYQPRVTLEQGLEDLAGWLAGQRAEDRFEHMRRELAARGLTG